MDLRKSDRPDWYRTRVAWVFFAMMAAFAVLFIRLYQLQVLQGDEYRRLSENNCIRLQYLTPARGLVRDSRGLVLAENRPAFDVLMTPRDVPEKEQRNVAVLLFRLLSLEPKKFLETLKTARKKAPFTPITLRQDLPRDLLAAVETRLFDLPGISVAVRATRYYPLGPVAAHITGYVGEVNEKELAAEEFPDARAGDAVGKFGLEKSLNQELAGRRGGRQVEVDARGRMVSVLSTIPAEPGSNVYLTLDSRLQRKAAELMEGQSGAVAAVETRTGKVLAMVSVPSFDPNWFIEGLSTSQWKELSENPDRPLQNKAIAGAYPPGSTYKVIPAMAGLEEGIINPDSPTYCPGYYQFGNRKFLCWKKTGHGTVALERALAESCDVYFYRLGEHLGVDRLGYYAFGCGMGQEPGTGLDHEAQGIAPTATWKKKRTGRPWVTGETLSLSIGQGYNLATPMQILTLYAAIENGGTRYRPQLVSRVETTDGKTMTSFRPLVEGRLPVSRKNLALIEQGLYGVVHAPGGTARIARLPNVEIWGKTGTAQVVSRRDESKFVNELRSDRMFQDHAWFVAYARPEGKQPIAVVVLVEHGGHGGSAAAPVARDLIACYARLDKPGNEKGCASPAAETPEEPDEDRD
ncbi:MAG: penicillin-binding protein 2 [Thermodesulfobacteriota bacterium]